MGFGSRSSLLGTMETKIVAITDNLMISHKDLLNNIVLNEAGDVSYEKLSLQFSAEELVTDEQLRSIREKLPNLIQTYKTAIYNPVTLKP
jgi:hypothetical protein